MPMLRYRSISVLALTALVCASAVAVQQAAELPSDTLPRPLVVERPLGLRLEASEADHATALIELGRRLFFSADLSPNRTASCATCHRPDHGFADPARFSIGHSGVATKRNAPTLLNRGMGTAFMWDGSAASLEEQVLMPIDNAEELGLGVEAAVERLAADAYWCTGFEQALGEPPTRRGLARALSGFVSVLRLGDSPLDHFQSGDASHMTLEEISGMWFFESRGGCWKCHSGPNFADDEFHNTGVGAIDGQPEPGRFAISGLESDRGRFKTPTLRGLEQTAPYMHDGSFETLEDVVQFYRDGGTPNANQSSRIGALDMTDADAANLVAFLRVLSRRVEGAAASRKQR